MVHTVHVLTLETSMDNDGKPGSSGVPPPGCVMPILPIVGFISIRAQQFAPVYTHRSALGAPVAQKERHENEAVTREKSKESRFGR